uniref:Putative secreted protein n=1 Tax=Lutzomyia longipalpis TaxID=7200 RepID=A0A1B0CCL4_LUTLO
MKTYIVLIVLSLACGSYAASVKALRDLITPKSDAAVQICGNGYGAKCFDCSTMLTCLGPTITPVHTTCPSDKPYCDISRNICTSLPPVGQDCDVPYTKTYLCMTSPDGFYPHPYDCERFFECYKGEL